MYWSNSRVLRFSSNVMQNWVASSKIVILYMVLTKCKTLLKHNLFNCIILINSCRWNVKYKELSSADSSQLKADFSVTSYL